jgi:hypothetical protein
MQESVVCALRAQRPQVRDRWAMLLRVEPVGTPLGHPDALVHLIDWTLDEIFAGLAHPLAGHDRGDPPTFAHAAPVCACGRNPLLTYFAAGQQAMREGLILAQASSHSLDPRERDASLAELDFVLEQIGRREVEAFCGVCQFRMRQGDECPAGALRFTQQAPEA